MANLKEIRNRITSVNSTMQITSAMKMVSAAKLKRAQDAVNQLRPYADKLKELLQDISSTLEEQNALSEQREVENVLLVVVTSNRGLCGAFNSNVIKKASALIQGEYATKKVSLLTIGKRGKDSLRNEELYSDHSEVWNDLKFEDIADIVKEITNKFLEGDFDLIRILYNEAKNAGSQVVINEQFLPIELSSMEGNQTSSVDYIFEPSKEDILEDLIPLTLKTQLYKAALDSNAAEHGARMAAMHKATDNAQEMSRELVLQYNKARQASITNEILEIVGGAEALGG